MTSWWLFSRAVQNTGNTPMGLYLRLVMLWAPHTLCPMKNTAPRVSAVSFLYSVVNILQ